MTYSTTSFQTPEVDESPKRILLPPTDPNAELTEIGVYKLVYVNGACPRNYRVYKGDSMIGLVFQHLTHWSNEVDENQYTRPLDAAVAQCNFITIAKMSKSNQFAA